MQNAECRITKFRNSSPEPKGPSQSGVRHRASRATSGMDAKRAQGLELWTGNEEGSGDSTIDTDAQTDESGEHCQIRIERTHNSHEQESLGNEIRKKEGV